MHWEIIDVEAREKARKASMGTEKRIAGYLFLAGETAGLIYAVFFSSLLTAWRESDAFAARATERDWWMEGEKSLEIVLAGSLILAAISYVSTRRISREIEWPLRNRQLCFAAVLCILMDPAGGLVGALPFAVWRSFL